MLAGRNNDNGEGGPVGMMKWNKEIGDIGVRLFLVL